MAGRVGSRGVVAADPAGLAPPGYRPRTPELGALHRLVHEHLETFLAEARARGDGDGLPHFVERELREFLTCGQLARGFARFRCDQCRADLLVAFSCKGRGFCPSCTGRRMASLAAHLVDDVLGGLPVRQWVLTTPHRLRYALAYDQRLCRRVLGVFIRAVLSFERRRARRRGAADGRGGAVTAIQRFGSAANLNIHFHSLVVQGVFAGDGAHFVPLPVPSDRDVWRVLLTVRRRIVRIAQGHGIDVEGDGIADDARRDELADESPLLAGLAAASVAGRSAIGADAGSRAVRLGHAPEAPPDDGSGAPRHAHIAGFDLHAGVAVPAGDRQRLEHLCRYVLRPPIAQGSLAIAPDGRVRLELRRPWRDGTRALLFDPLDFLGRLAALTPKPRVNLLLYHGVFAPHAARRRAAVARAREVAEGPAGNGSAPGPPAGVPSRPDAGRSSPIDEGAGVAMPRKDGWVRWADLLRRVFEIDVLHCARCGGQLRFVAAIDDPEVVRRILRHLGVPTSIAPPLPARSPPGLTQESFDWA
ncbi:transposase [Candidatus Binatia bacterium]|nr:transposase [Candidatus Binatia bacterium]